MSSDYEKLGAFYLGREFDPGANALKEDLVLYDSKDLTTHAVCVGMTGSGKTGLVTVLVEEALRAQVPTLIIDVKGDLPNLTLAFPEFAPSRLLPWVEQAPSDPRQRDELALVLAEQRRNSLTAWGIDEAAVAHYAANTHFRVITPGARATMVW